MALAGVAFGRVNPCIRDISLSHTYSFYHCIFQINKSLLRKRNALYMRQHTFPQILSWTHVAIPGVSIWPEQGDPMSDSGHDRDGPGHGAGTGYFVLREVSVEVRGQSEGSWPVLRGLGLATSIPELCM